MLRPLENVMKYSGPPVCLGGPLFANLTNHKTYSDMKIRQTVTMIDGKTNVQ